MPATSDARALSWMNYPDRASMGAPSNATWFYTRLRFRFDRNELLEQGGAAWFTDHGRVAHDSLDPPLELSLRSRALILRGSNDCWGLFSQSNIPDRI